MTQPVDRWTFCFDTACAATVTLYASRDNTLWRVAGEAAACAADPACFESSFMRHLYDGLPTARQQTTRASISCVGAMLASTAYRAQVHDSRDWASMCASQVRVVMPLLHDPAMADWAVLVMPADLLRAGCTTAAECTWVAAARARKRARIL